jgi:hypothetical protein
MSITQVRKCYLWKFLVMLIATLFVAGLINLVVDPYGTFQLVKISGLNRIKPNPDHDIETIKTHALHHISPDALILGNSRAEVGFDPSNYSWQEAGYNLVYNAAIRGSSLSTAWRLLENVADRHPPKLVLLGIDFFDFPIAPNKPIAPAKEITHSWLDDAHWLLRAVLTMQSLLDSATTVRRQFQNNPDQLTDFGQTPLRNYLDMAKAEGYWALFNQRAVENAKNHSRKPNNLLLEGTRSSPDFDEVRKIVRWAVQNNAEVRLVIYPYHAQLLIMIDELGLWPLFEEWKRQILRILDEEAPQFDSRERIILIDFSGFSSYAQEPIPVKGDKKSITNWYWEAGHFKSELGDIILRQILSKSQSHSSNPFGVNLNSLNIDQHIGLLRVSKDNFRACHEDMVTEIRAMVVKANRISSSPEGRQQGAD